MVELPEEEIEILAYRLYKQNMSYEECIWKLAELCKTIQLNIQTPNGDEWCNLNAFKTVSDIKDHLINGGMKYPTYEQVKPLAEKLAQYHPELSKLHWYIAEKMLVIKKLKEWLPEGKKQNK
ncbi:MAG: hypothetical protein ACTSRZ_07575 [Promethearchaeota archaeon]